MKFTDFGRVSIFIGVMLTCGILLVSCDRRGEVNEQQVTMNLKELVEGVITTARKHGFEIPQYQVKGFHTDAPLDASGDRHFFGYVESRGFSRELIVRLQFYEAKKMSQECRAAISSFVLWHQANREKRIPVELSFYADRYDKVPFWFAENVLRVVIE